MAENKKQITWTAAAATLLVAIAGWAVTTSSRVSALEANEAAHEQRITKAEQDADQYRKDMSEIKDRIYIARRIGMISGRVWFGVGSAITRSSQRHSGAIS